MNLSFLNPWWLTGLILIVFPVVNNGVSIHRYTNLSLVPADPLSSLFSWLLKLLAVAFITSLVLGLAGLYRHEQLIERIGHGANMVLLIDRSSSMDQTFGGQAPDGQDESKSAAAKRLLLDFIARRPNDRIGIVDYSTSPILAMPMTENKEAVAAAIAAIDTPALAYTNISKGLAMAFTLHQDGVLDSSQSGIIVLVSDGAAAIDHDNEIKLRKWFASRSMRLYWIFLRGRNMNSVLDKPEDPRDDNAQSRPERYLHLFFQSLKTPYRVFQADSANAMKAAVSEIDRLEKLPLHYTEKVPRKDLSTLCYRIAAFLSLLLLGLKLAEART